MKNTLETRETTIETKKKYEEPTKINKKKWNFIDKKELQALNNTKTMFRILFGYLIFDLLLHWGVFA